ncbi:MAG: hypothetical protein JSS66_14770 [Armatimonadetes bacterium]|nr:hypothetical protein [Armatimonadota bacterium]
MGGNEAHGALAGKVAKVTFAFWIIKIIATTLGETGGDALSMPPIELGYLVATAIFLGFFLVTVVAQVFAKRYHPFLFWAVIVATTTLGTTTADWLTRDLEFFGTEGPYYGATALVLFASLMVVLVLWRVTTGSISVSRITSKKAEGFYWAAILVSNTLGTALGDWVADTQGIGFAGGAMLFGAALLVIGALALFTKISRPILFWAAFILTRPLGATLGDILTKPLDHGGLNLSRVTSSIVIAVVMIPLIALFSRSAEGSEGTEGSENA